MPNMCNWPLPKSFKEDAMMNQSEKWEHERNMDEIVDRISELLVNIVLMSVKQVNEQYLPLKKRLDVNQPDDIRF